MVPPASASASPSGPERELPESGTDTATEAGPAAGLYVHVPFCTSVCPYCDFAVTIAGAERRAAWLEGVLREAELADWPGPAFGTVYLGGGTPSSLGPDQLERLVGGLQQHLPVAAGAHWSLEANPEDVTPPHTRAWRALGFGTVSLGLQSLDDGELAFLGRRHDATTGRRALTALLDAGFDTVAADFIFGLPGQQPQHWLAQLDAIVADGVQHLSCYQLTIHDGTVFGRRARQGELVEAPEDRQAELFLATRQRLGARGWDCYEVSNFARTPRHRSRHNQLYWRHAPYLGLGPSAHSFDGARTRWWNQPRLRAWQRAVDAGVVPIVDREVLDDRQLLLETVMLGLRCADGLDLGAVQRRFGVDLAAAQAGLLSRLTAEGLLQLEGERLRPTARGLAVADGLTTSIVP